MKYNNETSMEPHLQEAIQERLTNLNLHARTWQSKQLCMTSLNGITAALHALTGENWTCEKRTDGYVFVNESQTECISAEL